MTPAKCIALLRKACRLAGQSQASVAASAGIHRQSLTRLLSAAEASDAVLDKMGIERRETWHVVPGGVAERAIERALPKREGKL